MSDSSWTEDDTFNRLRRAPYREVIDRCKALGAPPGCSFIFHNREYIESQGWDVIELSRLYRIEYDRTWTIKPPFTF